MKQVILLTILLSTSCIIFGQNAEDALRYSIYNNYSTARVTSLGGSFGSLGGNIGGVIINPATLGIYRTDEITVTFSSDNENIESKYLSESSINTDRYKFFMQNLSYIKSTPIESDWNRINMSMNFNRLRDLDRQIHISGYNEESSMINDFFLEDAQGTYYEDLNYFNGTASAYWTDLIDLTDDATNDIYFSNLSNSNTGQNQELRIEEKGYINELGFTCSGAYKDFLFLGLSINLLDIDFSQQKSYTEYNFDEINDLQSFTYNTDLQVNGDGTNFKIGAIIKPTPSVRIGWAYHSKNYLSLYETYTSDMTANFTNFTNIDYFDYNLDGQRDIDEEFYDIQTPIKTISSLAVVFAKRGLISFDYETIDYGTARFEPNAYYSFAADNLDISTFYAKTNNIRVGLEWKLNKVTLRSGYAIYGSPFENEINDASREYMSIGMGFQNEQYFIDIAMIQSIEKEDYILYNNEFATLYNNGTTIMISCNYKF